MATKKNPAVSQEEVDRLLAEKLKEYEKQRTAWVAMKNRHIYVGYDVKDYVTELLMDDLINLVKLMRVDYAIKYPYGDDEEYYISIESEDGTMAEFIQKFLDNNYKLSW